jgi:hypothetical protein
MLSHRTYNYLNATFLIKIALGFSPLPSISEGKKVTLTPPPAFQGDISNLFNSEKKCLGKFMSSIYFNIIFEILQGFIPKMLEIAFQGL